MEWSELEAFNDSVGTAAGVATNRREDFPIWLLGFDGILCMVEGRGVFFFILETCDDAARDFEFFASELAEPAEWPKFNLLLLAATAMLSR